MKGCILLVRGISASEEERAVRDNTQLVRQCIRPYFLQGGDYDDLYQEGMLGLLSAIRSYDPVRNDNFQAYAALCIKRRVIDAVRRDGAQNRQQTRSESTLEYRPAGPIEEYDPAACVLANESAKEIKETLSGMLSPFEASVLDCYLEGYTSSEITERLGRSRKSVDNAIGRIRRKLASYLSVRR